MTSTSGDIEYRVVLGGISYGNKYVVPGEVVTDIPPQSVKWLIADGVIEIVSSKPKIAKPRKSKES